MLFGFRLIACIANPVWSCFQQRFTSPERIRCYGKNKKLSYIHGVLKLD